MLSLVSCLRAVKAPRISSHIWSTLKTLGIHYPQRKNRAGVKMQRQIRTIIGRRHSVHRGQYWSHDKWGIPAWGFPESSAGRHVNNLVSLSAMNVGLSVQEKVSGQNGVNRENLVRISITQEVQSSEMCVCMLNAQSCRNKAPELSDFIIDNHIDVLAMT